MTCVLKPGDRIRVTQANTMPGCQPGDTGTLKQGPFPAPGGGQYHIVQMDNDHGGNPVIFRLEEIEPIAQLHRGVGPTSCIRVRGSAVFPQSQP